ncbi:hypothetical protein L1276_001087 [Flavobacterium sp. HSC-32F16]|uniref:fibronectin type III domain-containing protein n=1 Tax=Flavobacterium sp. HSC-32F16 TaxID=2910964 RepID=UPI0020A381BA|nr:fibronectin type III domain-containing protein [Flavobacterium sp. HSC-32F16]MCP2025947.1 hypothetical protein [Flavobacterium sp. HSC-32F16]
MIKKLHLYLLLLCSLIGLGSYAQTFPIRITTQITQPSPIYLSNYADANTINSPIKIQLVLNDLTISNRQVRLKIYFQGNGIAFNTNDFVVGAKPLYLEGGFPLQLTNVDLAPYFEYQNLLGLTPNQYAQPLPEGVYNIYVEVYDFATGRKLSNKTGSTTIIFQNEPPFLNLPLNNASIMQQNIQNIVFGWTPRSINVSNVEYEFSLVEIWDKYTPVQNAFAYSPPLYTTTTRNTTLQYGINEPQLIPGKKYAWRIKAKALLGAEEIGVFKNNGYSEIFSFTYEVFCTAPLAINTEGISENQAKVTWSGSLDNFDYQVKYREKNSGSEWYDLVTPRETVTISNLKPNTTYEYTVGASCDVGKYTHSTVKEFTTLVRDEIAFQGCGIKPDPNDLANKNPLPQLFPNDVIAAGDFPIVVLHATGSNGSFSGDGYVTIPFLEKFRKLIDAADALGGDKVNIGQFSRIRITFNNIGLNTDFKLISGEIIAGYDPNWGGILDGDKLVDDITNLVDEYDPIMESIFGPKPKPEDIAQDDDNDDDVVFNPTPTETQTEYPPVVIVEVDEPQPSPPPIANETAPEKNDIKEEATSAPNNGAVTENGYYIEYKGQKYYNGGKIKIPYSNNMYAEFEMKTLSNDAKVIYRMYEPGKQEKWLSYESTTSKSNLQIESSALTTNLRIFDLEAEATNVEGNPKVRVEIEKVVTKFTQNSLTATDEKASKRSAIAPYTLYYINKPNKTKDTKIEVTLSQKDFKKIPKENFSWKINDIDDPHKAGTSSFSMPLTNKIKDVKFTNIAGYPNLTTKEVKIKWIDENRKTSKFVIGTSSSPFLEDFFKLTEQGKKIGKRLEKIPFIKNINKNEQIKSGIGFYYDVIPMDQTIVNVEDPNSRLYYTEKTIAGGIEIGLEGSSKFTLWGIPYDKIPYLPDWAIEKAKKIIKAEVFAVAKAKVGGDLKIEYVQKKLAEQNAWKDVSKKVNPAKIALNIEFGVGAEIKLLEDNENFSVGGDANGMAKAELGSIGWYNNKFDTKILQEGVWIDFTAGMYIRVAGVKYETAPIAKKIQIIEPADQ